MNTTSFLSREMNRKITDFFSSPSPPLLRSQNENYERDASNASVNRSLSPTYNQNENSERSASVNRSLSPTSSEIVIPSSPEDEYRRSLSPDEADLDVDSSQQMNVTDEVVGK